MIGTPERVVEQCHIFLAPVKSADSWPEPTPVEMVRYRGQSFMAEAFREEGNVLNCIKCGPVSSNLSIDELVDGIEAHCHQ